MKNIKLLLIGLAAAFALTGCGDSSKACLLYTSDAADD